MTDYAYLTPVLQAFGEAKWYSFANIQEHQDTSLGLFIGDSAVGKTPFALVLEDLGITDEQFGERFWKHWDNLSLPQLINVLKLWNVKHRFIFGHELVLKPLRELIALHWTVINVFKLNLPGLVVFSLPPEYFETHYDEGKLDFISSLYQTEVYALPHLQCNFCGRLETDPRGKPFGKQHLDFCHQVSCITHSVNLPDHDPDCCYRQWNRLKDNLKRNLKNNQANPAEVVRLFEAFCEKRFQENLKLESYPRPQLDKPKAWKHPWSDLEKRSRAKSLARPGSMH